MTPAANLQPRTITEIVYGCMITLILCLSYCIRPNISSPSTSTFHAITRKLRIIFWIVIAPELIVSWAVNQWMEGNKVARLFSARGWTSSHGQFFVMGGFLLYKDGRPFQVLSPDMFINLLDSSCIEFPSHLADELREKSTAHPLFAIITFIQTVWFIVQIIARRIQGLAITPLEVATLSLIVMNALLLPFWWHKPLDPRSFVRIDLIRTPPPSPPDLPDGDFQVAIKLDFSREQSIRRQVKTAFKTETWFLAKNRRNPFLRALDSWLCAPVDLFERMLNDYGELFLRLDKNTIPEGSTDVSVFYTPDTIENLGGFLFTLKNILGSLFAAAHMSMWYYYFPTYRDEMAWRIASLFTVGLPLVFVVGLIVLVFSYVLSLILTNRLAGILLQAMQIFATAGVLLGFIGLLIARMVLIVEAFVCLRSAGGTTLQAVSWTKYIPHFS